VLPTTLAEVTSVEVKGDRATFAASPTVLGLPDDRFCGYGLLSGWNMPGRKCVADTTDNGYRWWKASNGSQGHGVLKWEGGKQIENLVVGQKVRIIPSRASTIGEVLGRYFVVDSDREGKEDEVVDVWVRWRGLVAVG
jgi:D-serine deaminase-like pyridoxal phosphate-dependent protein